MDEIFLSATRLDNSQHTTRAGDYSVVLMRRVVGNEAVIHLITGDLYTSPGADISFPRTYSLANFIDLDRDGNLELVVDIQGWEEFGALVYQINGQDLIEVP